MTALTIEVWSDVACPWCWVGKRHLDEALEQLDHEANVVWRAFELDPDAPKTAERDVDYVGRLAAKYGTSRAGAEDMIAQMTARGARAGLEFRFDRVQPASTFDAHRVLHFAGMRGRQHDMKERLMLAYFNEGRLVSDRETLVELAGEVGLPKADVDEMLRSEQFREEVRTEQAVAQQLGIRGVPFFVIAGRYAVRGAQPPEPLVEAMGRAWDETADAPAVEGSHEVCGPDGCVLPVTSPAV